MMISAQSLTLTQLISDQFPALCVFLCACDLRFILCAVFNLSFRQINPGLGLYSVIHL